MGRKKETKRRAVNTEKSNDDKNYTGVIFTMKRKPYGTFIFTLH